MQRIILCLCTSLAFACSTAIAAPVPNTHSGNCAAKITNTTSVWTGDTGMDRGSSMIQVVAGHTLRLTFWARSANAGTTSRMERASFAFFKDAGGLQHLGDFSAAQGAMIGDEWTSFTLDQVVPAEGAYCSVSFRVSAGGTPPHSIVVDDISVKDIAAGDTEILPNGGLEDWTTEFPTGWRWFAVNGSTGSFQKVAPAAAKDWQLHQ